MNRSCFFSLAAFPPGQARWQAPAVQPLLSPAVTVVTRLPVPVPGACVAVPLIRFAAQPHSALASGLRRGRLLAPPTPRPVARSCPQASQLLWPGLTSRPRASPASAPQLPDADRQLAPPAKDEISRFPYKERPCMLGSLTAPGRPTARDSAAGRVAFQAGNPAGTRDNAFTRLDGQPRLDPLRGSSTCRGFALPLAEPDARRGAGVARQAFTAKDLHLLLPVGLPTHCQAA